MNQHVHHYASDLDSTESTRGYRQLQTGARPCSEATLETYAERVSVWHLLLTMHFNSPGLCAVAA
jgi:hypothetical protein